MFKYLLIGLLVFAVAASAQSVLTPEDHFFGIPGLDNLSNVWFLTHSDSSDIGFAQPMAVDVLKLSAYDYRVIVLSSDGDLFTVFRLDQTDTLAHNTIVHSGGTPVGCKSASAMCQVRQAELFNPVTDRIAVSFASGARVGIYAYEPGSGQFTLERSFAATGMLRPMGIYSAFGNFFIADDSLKTIFRTDSAGAIKSTYGQPGHFGSGYDWLNNISGYVDESSIAHLFVADGSDERVDHLTAKQAETSISLQAQGTTANSDSFGMHVQEAVYVPGSGVVALSTYTQCIYRWSNADLLTDSVRTSKPLTTTISPAVHIATALGRVVLTVLDTSGWVLRSYTVEGAPLDDPIALPTNEWPVNISPVVLSTIYHVTSGDTLIIDPGVHVQFGSGAGMVVDEGGRLIVNGSDGAPVDFHAQDPNFPWIGLKLDQGSTADLNYLTISDADSFCLFADTPAENSGTPLTLDHCHLSGAKLADCTDALRILGKPTYTMQITNSRIDSVVKGRGMYLYDCNVTFAYDTISGCDTANSYFKQVTGTISNCVFEGRASGHGLLFEGPDCTPNFQCCLIRNLAPGNGSGYTMYALRGSAPTFGWEDGSGYSVANVISDSSQSLLWFEMDKVMPIIDNIDPLGGPGGMNDWYQQKSGGFYLDWYKGTVPPQYSAQNQYWNNGGTDPWFYPAATSFRVDSVEKSAWGLCGGQSITARPPCRRNHQGLDDPDSAFVLFTSALHAEHAGNYSTAQSGFHSVAATASDDHLRWQALTHVVSTQRHLNSSSAESWIPALIDSIVTVDSTYAADSSGYHARVYGNRLLAAFRTDREQFSDAIETCTDLLGSGLTQDDSLLVAIDLIGIEMLADSGTGGHLDSPYWSSIPTPLQVRSVTHGLALEKDLLRQLQNQGHVTKSTPALPARYMLYQNYPNPFNPVTEIRFDLPAAAHVELRIYNTLGQLVTTLLNENRQAGTHRLAWDGSRYASGLYIYQIKTPHFTDSKKMLLIR